MNTSRIIAECRLHFPAIRDLEINKHISTALTQLSEVGFSRIKKITVTAGSTGLDPLTRTNGIAYNYYPDLKCLLMPEDLLSVANVRFGDIDLDKANIYQYNTGTMPNNSYFLTETNEMYLSFELETNDILEIDGTWAVRNIELLSDKYENWMLNHVLSRLYSCKPYKDADQYAIYEAERQRAWRVIKNNLSYSGSWIAKDGVLA